MLQTQQPSLAAEYKRKRAEENGPLILRVFTILTVLVSAITVLWGVMAGADVFVAIFVLITFGLWGGAYVLRFTAFGKANPEGFATVLATVLLLALVFMLHINYENASVLVAVRLTK